MSAETAWCAASAQRTPVCNRLIRLPYHEQIGMAAELAVARARGTASCRATWNTVTDERTWLWPERPGKHGDWWMLPLRTMRLADKISQYAGGNIAIMQRVVRRAAKAREWHRRNPLPGKGQKAHISLWNFLRPRGCRPVSAPHVVGYESAYVGRGMWRVVALDCHGEVLRLIGSWQCERDADACARRCSRVLYAHLRRLGGYGGTMCERWKDVIL